MAQSPKKKPTRSSASAPQKKKSAPAARQSANAAKRPTSTAKRPSPVMEQHAHAPKKKKSQRSAFASVFPYLLVVFALVLAICFITVRLLDMDDGAGVIGYGIQWFFCGLFGGAAFLLPVALGFIGVIFILFHVHWKASDSDPDSAYFEEYRRIHRRVIRQTVMTFLAVLLIAMMITVLSGEEYELSDLGLMWTDAADDLLGGGLLGGIFGTLMVLGFKQVISMIILVTALILVILVLIGITPDYIISKIEEGRLARREEKEALAVQMAEEQEALEKEEKKHAARMAAAAARKDADTAEVHGRSMSADEIADFSDGAAEEATHQNPEPYIGPSEDSLAAQANSTNASTAESEQDKPLYSAAQDVHDFGGDEGFSGTEYTALDDFIRNADLKSEAAPTPEKTPEAPLEMNQIGTDEILSDAAAIIPEEGEPEPVEEPVMPYVFPPIDLLEMNRDQTEIDYTEELQTNARRLVETLRNFKVGVQEITYSRGPTITRYELKPSAGVKVRSIANLVDDIALSLATSGVRIEAPIPNKPAVGIEVPNRNRATVYLRDLIDNAKFKEAKSRLTSSLGMDVGGNPIYFDIAKMPHLLIAGATGMGKSVCINSIIVSLLYKAKPEEVKLILIDPKKVEFNIYKDIPHLYAPIISDPKKAAGALASAVAEMERRFELIEEVGVRDIATYNAVTENDPAKEHMTHMVIIIDELADLMMTAKDEVETSICRLAQKARAAGIHIIIGTQRPSVDVITGLIKANIPSRIACTVASQVDSRTIIDIAGAEKLIGRGDMLFAPVGSAKPVRVQGSFVSEAEVEKIVTFIKENNAHAKYNNDFINRIEEEAAKCGMKKGGGMGGDMIADDEVEGGDSKFREAVKLAIESGKISTSLMQRRLGVGYGRAAKIIDTMEQLGYVSRPDGNKPRQVLISMEEYMRRVTEGTLGSTED